jgi:hypothetical protein
MRSVRVKLASLVFLSGSMLLTDLWSPRPAAAQESADAPAPARKKRQPPPAVIPTADTHAAEQALKAGRYEAAVAGAQAAPHNKQT